MGVTLEGPARAFSLRKCCGRKKYHLCNFQSSADKTTGSKEINVGSKNRKTEVIAPCGVARQIRGNTQLIDTLKVRACADMFLRISV